MFRSALLVLLLSLWTGAARAETAVLLSARGDEGLPAQKAAAHAELREALSAQGVRVIEQAEAASEMDAQQARCDSVDCAPELLRAANAEIAAAIAVWSDSSRDGQQTVFVTLVDRNGARFPGKAEVQDDDVALATRDALLDARSLQLLGPGPWLRVTSTVDGAQVLLDGELVGSVPYRAPVTPGRHTLEVRSDGYRPHVQTVDIPPNAARQMDVEAELSARERVAVEAEATYPEGAVDSPSIAGPLILGVAGLGVLGVDIALVLSSGCQKRHESGTCLEPRDINTGAAIAWGAAGTAMIAGAILWYVLDEPADSAQDDVALRVGPGGVSLSGSF